MVGVLHLRHAQLPEPCLSFSGRIDELDRRRKAMPRDHRHNPDPNVGSSATRCAAHRPSPRRRFQFRLRMLMIGVTLLAGVCGYVAWREDRARAGQLPI